ncbi:hypothetical protein IFM89_033170 [Coptis chinensis]|uniref:Protein OS9-like domain-containing protein n=1 Tax=Coptis chinensis TaxID=261450 RepID=A0A835M2W8_9MAGN|nr:hypothetical protein IFM89_033170 [Coptis chinensis]
MFVHCTFIYYCAGGGGFGRSSHEPKYKIEFHEPHSPFHPDDDQESMVMSDKNGQKFSCFLPKEDKTKTSKFFTHQNTSSLIVETQRKVTLKTPDELLEVFKDKCLYRQEGWWSYEFCYQKNFRQLHLEGDKGRRVVVAVIGRGGCGGGGGGGGGHNGV